MDKRIDRELRERLQDMDSSDSIDVLIQVMPDERIRKYINAAVDRDFSGYDDVDTPEEALHAMRLHNEDLLRPVMLYLHENNIAEECYNQIGGMVHVRLTKEHIYRVAEISSVGAIHENRHNKPLIL